jgi:hypothetical protein
MLRYDCVSRRLEGATEVMEFCSTEDVSIIFNTREPISWLQHARL